MNYDAFRSKWSRVRSEVRRRWRGLTEADVDEIQGRPSMLVRKLRERCGVPKDDATAEVEAWFRTVDVRPGARR